jgi:hypothetical protein
MVQDLIGSLSLCALTGYALSLVVAACLSQWTKGLSILSISAALLLAAGPIYLGVDSIVDQGAGSIALAMGSLVFGLYCLRGWWVPERFPIALVHGSHFRAATKALRPLGDSSVSAPPPALRHRMLSVVRSDRKLQRHARNTSLADAA